MNLSNVVEQGDPLDAAAFVLVEISGPREDQRICRNPSQVSPRFMIVRIDGVEQRLEGGSGEALRGTSGGQLPRGEDAADSAHGDAGEGPEHTLFLRHCTQTRQEVGDTRRERP
jgi:hypothetical protein